MNGTSNRKGPTDYRTRIAICLTRRGFATTWTLGLAHRSTRDGEQRDPAEQPRQTIERAQHRNKAIEKGDLLLGGRPAPEHATVPPPSRDRGRVEGPDAVNLEARARNGLRQGGLVISTPMANGLIHR